MPQYLVEAYQAGGVEPPTLAHVDPPVRHVRSVYVPADEVALHFFDAPSAEAVRDALVRISFVHERVVEARSHLYVREEQG